MGKEHQHQQPAGERAADKVKPGDESHKIADHLKSVTKDIFEARHDKKTGQERDSLGADNIKLLDKLKEQTKQMHADHTLPEGMDIVGVKKGQDGKPQLMVIDNHGHRDKAYTLKDDGKIDQVFKVERHAGKGHELGVIKGYKLTDNVSTKDGKITDMTDANHVKVHIDYDQKSGLPNHYERGDSKWTSKNGEDWTRDGSNPPEKYKGKLSTGKDDSVIWTATDPKDISYEFKPDGSQHLKQDRAEWDLNHQGKLAKMDIHDDKGNKTHIDYDKNEKPTHYSRTGPLGDSDWKNTGGDNWTNTKNPTEKYQGALATTVDGTVTWTGGIKLDGSRDKDFVYKPDGTEKVTDPFNPENVAAKQKALEMSGPLEAGKVNFLEMQAAVKGMPDDQKDTFYRELQTKLNKDDPENKGAHIKLNVVDGHVSKVAYYHGSERKQVLTSDGKIHARVDPSETYE